MRAGRSRAIEDSEDEKNDENDDDDDEDDELDEPWATCRRWDRR